MPPGYIDARLMLGTVHASRARTAISCLTLCMHARRLAAHTLASFLAQHAACIRTRRRATRTAIRCLGQTVWPYASRACVHAPGLYVHSSPCLTVHTTSMHTCRRAIRTLISMLDPTRHMHACTPPGSTYARLMLGFSRFTRHAHAYTPGCPKTSSLVR